jgi:hypothetical protein
MEDEAEHFLRIRKEDNMRILRLNVPVVVLMVAMAFMSSSVWAAVDYSSTLNVFKASPQVRPFLRLRAGTPSFQPSGRKDWGWAGHTEKARCTAQER